MAIDISQWHLTMKCHVLHYSDCLSHPQPILDLIDVVNTTFQHIPFDSKLTANRLGRFQPRMLKQIGRNWSKVLSEIQEGRVSTLVYGSFAPNGYDWQVGVYFHMFHEQTRQREPDSRQHWCDSMGFWVEHTLLQEGVVTLAMCLHLMRQAWERLRGVYAFADMFVTHRTGLVSDKQRQEAAHAMRAKVGSYEVERPRVDLRMNVPDAYWLNFLNATHVETLGGIDQIKTSLPVAQIEPLLHVGVSIQIAASPIYDSTEAWQADHAALENVLAPILSNQPPHAAK